MPIEIRVLIRRMSRENPLWGAPKIHGELLKLGIDVGENVGRQVHVQTHEAAVSDLANVSPESHRRHGLDRLLHRADGDVSDSLRIRGLSHSRRKVLHFNVTDSPTAAWTSRQLIQAFPWDTAPKYLLRDRDKIYGHEFHRTARNLGFEQIKISPRSPWQNPYVERVIGSIRRECLDHIIIFSENHLRKVLRGYLDYYHESRTHLGLGKDCPETRPVETSEMGKVEAIPMVGGLHHRYTRIAA
ncbi:MAG: integrase core domain-containing protein [Candidatus Eisenbacteria bacterium]